jgi:predicted ATP-dependent protease
VESSTNQTWVGVVNHMSPELRVPRRPARELSYTDLYRSAVLTRFKFRTTDDLKSLVGVIEQDRAVRALELGLTIDNRNYNVYVAGSSGTGKTTVLKTILAKIAPKSPTPSDWIYVHNFRDPSEPHAIEMAPGEANRFRHRLRDIIAALREQIPQVFHAKEHQETIQGILNEGLDQENECFVELSQIASKIGFTIKSTKTGIVTIPMVGDKVVSNKDYAQLNDEERRTIEENRKKLDPHISEFLQKTRDVEMQVQARIQDAQRELAEVVSTPHFETFGSDYTHNEVLIHYLGQLYEDILENISKFLPDDGDPDATRAARKQTLKEYEVNVIIDNGECDGAPVVFETHPTFSNMFGKLERRLENGVYFTDFTLIRSGSLLKASGGFLVVNVLDLFSQPGVWEHLKSCLRNKEVTFEDPGFLSPFLPAAGIKPEPMPTRPKLILHGSSWAYYLLYRSDEDFRKIFQVLADFDSEIDKTQRTVREYAQFVATTCKNNNLLPVDKNGIASIVEEGGRLADDKRRLTLKFNDIANLVVEADYHARNDGNAKVIKRAHIDKAIDEREHRSALVADKLLREIVQGRQLIDVSGRKVGQVNGLAVYSVGEHRFAKPSRITVSTYAGKGGITNIERESKLSGRIHDKGVFIVQGYLGQTYAQKTPLSLNTTICFEQSYGGVDGDSASSAELYCILSSLSEIPLKQGIAVTGSVNQKGEIQPIGGVNEKVEGFFRVCSARKLTGDQGCVIPVQNIQNLMLRKPVRDAVKAGKFHIWPIKHVNEGIEILMGVVAGRHRKDGTFTPNTVHARVMKRLEELAVSAMPKKPEKQTQKKSTKVAAKATRSKK